IRRKEGCHHEHLAEDEKQPHGEGLEHCGLSRGRICDNVVALDAGTLVASGPLAQLVGDDEGVVLEIVEVADRPGAIEQVSASLTGAGFVVRPLGVGTVEVIGPDVDLVADGVRDALAASGARLGKVVRRRRRLEDLFHIAAEVSS
ncbi:MAG: hypothetical protein RLN74_16825, partial [Ilumatobacter fluminis]